MAFLNRYSAVFLPLIFFIIALFTLYDYGMNWDSPIHFARGQAYLRYMLTGKTDYLGAHHYCENSQSQTASFDFATGEICNRHRKVRVSEYESVLLDFNSWVAKDAYGHPAFSGLMLAASNNIFFKVLGWVEDIPAYHLYNIFATFILALTISIWTKQTFGTFASIVAVLALYTFPLLAGEQHFNVKDPPMAAFFTLSIYLFWLAIIKKRSLYMIYSALAGGASFGTKFNFVFAPFILLPWIIVYGKSLLLSKMIRPLLSRKMLIAIALYPIIIFFVFFLTWPALWSDPIKNVSEVIRYYREIGGSKCPYLYFTPLWFTSCTQLLTLKYFFFSVPPFTIFLFIVGSIAGFLRFKEQKFVTVLWLSFFYFTLLRVTFSVTSIYGGLRQIMEFVAPMAMISGLGALFLRDKIIQIFKKIPVFRKFNNKSLSGLISILILLGFVPVVIILIKLHPNENIYFNFFVGGIRGAAEKNFPGYGNTYGNAYMQGIKWLNQNTELNSKLALTSGLGQNLSRGSLRGDIDYANNYRSGYNLEGEYQILLIEGDDPLTEAFRYQYLSFLNPVYVSEVDSIPLLKIWKNDKAHLKKNISFESQLEKKLNIDIVKDKSKDVLVIDLGKEKILKSLGMKFQTPECKDALVGAKILISTDGTQYTEKAEGINNFSEREIFGYDADFVYLFPADTARYIRVTPPENYPCNLTDTNFSVTTFINYGR